MAIDFKKLSDPAYRAEAKARREAEEAQREAEDKRIREAVDLCMRNADSLPDADRRFVYSVHCQLNSFSILSDKQLKWLHDVADRIQAVNPVTQDADHSIARTHRQRNQP